MKKIVMLACMVLFLQQTHAQYFQQTYGNPASIENNAQFIPCSMPTAPPLPPSGPGYVLVGSHIDTTMPNARLQIHLVHTNNAGMIPAAAPYFNKRIMFINPGYGDTCHVEATSVDEIPNGGGTFDYIVAGNIIVPRPFTVANFFVFRMTAAGVITWFYRYSFPNYTFINPKLKMDNAKTNILVTGIAADLLDTTKGTDVFAFKINPANGVVLWGRTYDIKVNGVSQYDEGHDIIDNPYTANEALIVGLSDAYGLLLRLNSANGMPSAVTPTTRYNLPGSASQQLNCINLSGNIMMGNASPFIVGGDVLWNNAPNDAWTMLINQTGIVSWSTTHDTGLPGAPLDNTLEEVMERFNQNTMPATFEYYTAGKIINTQVQTLKLNGIGMLFAGGEFQYGPAGTQELGQDIHPSNTGGFALSGTTALRSTDQLLLTAYYNGVQPNMPAPACPFSTHNFNSLPVTPKSDSPEVFQYSNPVRDTLDTAYATLGMSTICLGAGAMGGSNLKQTPFSSKDKADDGFNFTVLGTGEQGVSTGSDLHITVQNNSSGQLAAHIVDLLGREYKCELRDDGDGRFSISTNIPSTGTYYIVLSNGKETKSKVLFVK